MAPLAGKIRAFRSSPHFSQILKFGTVSVVATVITQALLFAFYPHLIRSAMESNALATALSSIPAYVLNRRWTWGKRGKSSLWKEVIPFWTMAFIGLALSTIIVGVAAHNASHVHFISKQFLVHLANLVSYGLIWAARYSLIHRFLFGPTTQAAGGEVVDPAAVEETGSPAEGTLPSAAPSPSGISSTEPSFAPYSHAAD